MRPSSLFGCWGVSPIPSLKFLPQNPSFPSHEPEFGFLRSAYSLIRPTSCWRNPDGYGGLVSTVVAKAAVAINEALRLPELKETFAKFGMEPLQGSSESFAALIKSDLAAWGPVIKASGFTVED